LDEGGAARPGEAWAHHGAAFADAEPRDVSYPAPAGLADDLCYPESEGPPHGLASVLQSLLEFSGTTAPRASILADIGLIHPEHLPAAAGASAHASEHGLPHWPPPEAIGLPAVGAAHDIPHADAHPDALTRTDHAFDMMHLTHPVLEQ
jgi:hypothetical protein